MVAKSRRLQIAIHGVVQGVGFRPFVYRLATDLGLHGWVNNSAQGVLIDVEGTRERLMTFLDRVECEKPTLAAIHDLNYAFAEPVGYADFEIRYSDASGAATTLILPDIATCPDCLKEIFDPSNPRYLYPFTNCTNCGPRFSIIEALPYDRAHTTMSSFVMCDHCRAEYENPLDRRFHAQPIACPKCGPHLELWNTEGTPLATHHEALLKAAEALRSGQIIAVKGLGGFHLMVDARNQKAVQQLRDKKHRPTKPFAVMLPSLEMAKDYCDISELEAQLLTSPEAPIVLLKRKENSESIAAVVAPNNPYLGVMLPYTPLHHLLMAELGFPIVATSGNLSDEPICIDEQEALIRLHDIADLFLVHNRPIVQHIDDSILRVVAGREMMIRRGRGYAPLPITLDVDLPPILAVGAHLKNTVAASIGKEAFVSQHIGSLSTPQAFEAFDYAIKSFRNLYGFALEAVACDLHPDYLSTQYAHDCDLPVIHVQHHYAHALACMAENKITGPTLAVIWDGSGYGLDHTIWGGEFLLIHELGFDRVAHLWPFALPGGEKAIEEPRRLAAGLLYKIYGDDIFDPHGKFKDLAPLRSFSRSELLLLQQMLDKGINSPLTSSAGRLFDAVASLLGLCQQVAYEGEAAARLEFALEGAQTNKSYCFEIWHDRSELVIDWIPTISDLVDDLAMGVSVSEISAKFHNTLVEMLVQTVKRIDQKQLVLAGGCFQNKYLLERAIQRLQEEGFDPYWHRRLPPNDGSIALGQLAAAARSILIHPGKD